MALEDKSKCCENYFERENYWGELEFWGGGLGFSGGGTVLSF